MINMDNNNKNEILFWKVFHNKFLFQKIIDCIEICESYKYDIIKQRSKRIKFKYIDSLEWMIKKRQYLLLKCKLEAGEFIKIDLDSLETIFYGELIQKNEFYGIIRYDHPSHCIDDKPNKEITFNKVKKIEAIQLLLKFYNCSNLLNYVLKEISRSPISIVELIINKFIGDVLITEEIRNNSIVKAFYNTNHRDEMLEFILNNTQLYNIPLSSNSVSSNGSGEERLKKLEAHHIFFIKSKEIRNRLFSLNYFKPVNEKLIKSEFNNQNHEILIETLNKINNSNGMECKYVYINKLESFYYQHDFDKDYCSQNKILLDDNKIYEIYVYAIKTFSANALLYIVSIDGSSKIKYSFQYSLYNLKPDPIKKRNINETIEFIKVYTNYFQYFENKYSTQDIIQLITSSNSNEYYQSLVNSISPNCNDKQLTFYLNEPWSPLTYNQDSSTNDEISIDWYVDNGNNYKNPIDFKFKTDFFSNSIRNISLPVISLFLRNGFNPIKTNSTTFLKYWYEKEKEELRRINGWRVYGECSRGSIESIIHLMHKDIYDYDKNWGITYITSNESIDPIISLIDLLISNYLNDFDHGCDEESYFKCIGIVINYLLNKLISRRLSTIEIVENVRTKIIKCFGYSFIQHSTFQCFYYILLKSPRLLSFILTLQNTVEQSPRFLLQEHRIKYGEYCTIKEYSTIDYPHNTNYFNNLDFVCLIDPEIFTYEFIRDESFNNILEKLIEILVYSTFIKNPRTYENYNKTLNAMLVNLLEIKHYQLFFKQLEYIKQNLLDNPNLNVLSIIIKYLDSQSFNSFEEYRDHFFFLVLKYNPDNYQ